MNGMRKLLFILMVLPFTLNVRAEDPPSMLEKAVSNIKRWEGWHRGKMPYIGFGHRLLPHEKLTENLSEAQADSLLRCDLERCLKVFRKYGKDSLLLSCLLYTSYTRLLEESNDVLQDLKQVINVSTLSMTDKDRMDVVDNCYYEMRRYRNLVSYYTNKNIAVSYLRARKKNDMERVMRLYGNETSKYW